ncbi:MAG: sigma-70 family RNA polymerase sigma factor [Pedobacter sp.]|nr:MAG: sigma-70 family RNA polymerase sigma factor [Pedobacter sp.]
MSDSQKFDELFLRLKTGDRLAYEEIYRLHSKELLQLAYRKTRDKVVAEDLVQNIFISIWDKRERLEVHDGWNYLCGALKFSIINYIRSQVIENKYLDFSRLHFDESEGGSNTAELNDLSSVIERGLTALPEKTQKIFRLSRYEHQSTKNISSTMNISEKTVEYHITRSLKWMKKYIDNNYTLITIFFFL